VKRSALRWKVRLVVVLLAIAPLAVAALVLPAPVPPPSPELVASFIPAEEKQPTIATTPPGRRLLVRSRNFTELAQVTFPESLNDLRILVGDFNAEAVFDDTGEHAQDMQPPGLATASASDGARGIARWAVDLARLSAARTAEAAFAVHAGQRTFFGHR
jgi:hypothetical protein